MKTPPEQAWQVDRDEEAGTMALKPPRLYFHNQSTDLSRPQSALLSVLPKKLYALRGDVSAGYHQQLASSLQAFQARPWHPLKLDDMEPVVVRCRPVSARPEKRPYTSNPGYVPAPPARPRSQLNGPGTRPGSCRRRAETPEVNPGNFDTLHPRIITDLMGRQDSPLPTFGDRPLTDDEHEKEHGGKDDNSTTSGIDSIQSEDGSRSDSEGEGEGEEPPLDKDRPVPDLQLRPEVLDSMYVPDSRKDRRRFDFDASSVDLPPYEFPAPLPRVLEEVDLTRCARMKMEWRELLPPGTDVNQSLDNAHVLVSRLVELERLQLDTEDWERSRLRTANARRTPAPTSRVGSARARDRRCCSTCLQAACVGDCPEKSLQFNVCNRCRQAFCTGTCSDNKYEQRMRQNRSEDAGKTAQPVRASRTSCNLCQSKKTNAKLLNANNLVLGRPRSSMATFSRGQNSCRPPRDLRPKWEEEVEAELNEELQRLGIDPVQPRSRTGKGGRPRGRNGLLPGKTYFSNRKDSITDIPEAVSNERKRRGKTMKLRRPKTPSRS